MTETLTPAAPAADDGTDWLDRLYDEASADTHSYRPAPVPAPCVPRFPPPGQVVDLDKAPAADSAADEAGEDPDDAADAELPDDDDADALYEECDDDDEFAEDDDSDDKPRGRVRRPVRDYFVGQHTDFARRRRNLVYSASAAAAGWGFGLEGWCQHLITECGAQTRSTGAAVVLGLGLVGVAVAVIDRRTRHWYTPLAWVCRIPAASAVAALALYSGSLAAR